MPSSPEAASAETWSCARKTRMNASWRHSSREQLSCTCNKFHSQGQTSSRTQSTTCNHRPASGNFDFNFHVYENFTLDDNKVLACHVRKKRKFGTNVQQLVPKKAQQNSSEEEDMLPAQCGPPASDKRNQEEVAVLMTRQDLNNKKLMHYT